MEEGDLLAFEFVTPNGERSWSLASVQDCSRTGVVDVVLWYDSSSGQMRGKDAQEYNNATVEAEECDAAARRLGQEVATLRKRTLEQRALAEENARVAQERLQAALAAVRTIDNSHLREMRSYRTPPTLVKETLAAVLHLLRLSPSPETWENVQKLVRRPDFIPNVLNFDPDNQDDALNRSVLVNYLSNPAMTVESVHQASHAAGPLLQWLLAKIGATTAHVELRSFDAEARATTEKLKETSKKIELLQRKGQAARVRAESVRQRVEAIKLSFRKAPGQDANDNVWVRDAESATTTILTSSILCNFGLESSDSRSLTRDELDQIVEAHESAKRDNNERVRVALEALSASEQEREHLCDRLREVVNLRDQLLEEVELERELRVAVEREKNDSVAVAEGLHQALRDAQVALRAAEEGRLELLEQAAVVEAAHRALIQEKASLQSEVENLKLFREKAAEEEERHLRERANVERERQTVLKLQELLEQEHVEHADDVLRRERRWQDERDLLEQRLAEAVKTRTHETSQLEAKIAELTDVHREQISALEAKLREHHQQAVSVTSALEERESLVATLKAEVNDAERRCAALSSTIAQRSSDADAHLGVSQSLREAVHQLEASLAASEQCRQDLTSEVERLNEEKSAATALVSELRSDVTRLQEEHNRDADFIASTSATNLLLKEEVTRACQADLTAQQTAFEQEIRQARDAHQCALNALRGELARVSNEQRDVMHSQETERQLLEDANQQVDTLRALLSLEQSKRVSAESELHTAAEQHDELQQRLDTVMVELATSAAVHTTEMLQARASVAKLEEQLEQVAASLERSRVAEARAEEECRAVKRDRSALAQAAESAAECHKVEVERIRLAAESHSQLRGGRSPSKAPATKEWSDDELVLMQQRLERELQYMQSVHASVIAQHVQLEREQRLQIDGLLRDSELLRCKLREVEERLAECDKECRMKERELTLQTTQMSTLEEQVQRLLLSLEQVTQERDALAATAPARDEELRAARLWSAECEATVRQRDGELCALQAAYDASVAVEEELKAEMSTLAEERRQTLAELEQQASEFEQRLRDQHERHRESVSALQQEVDELYHKLSDTNRRRLESNGELVDVVGRLQQEKKDVTDDLLAQLDAAREAAADEKRKLSLLSSELQTAHRRAEQLERDVGELREQSERDAEERRVRLTDLVRLHHEQLVQLRSERDDVVLRLQAEERRSADAEYALAELRAKVSRSELSPRRSSAMLGSAAGEEADDLRARVRALAHDLDSAHLVIREKDAQLHDLNRRIVEYELLLADKEPVRATSAQVRGCAGSRTDKAAGDANQQADAPHLAPDVVAATLSSTNSGRAAPRSFPRPELPPKGMSTPRTLTAAAVGALSSGVAVIRQTPSVTSSRHSDWNLEGAHLAVTIGTLVELQHGGKPLRCDDVFVKLKTIKEKYHSDAKPLRQPSVDINNQFVFHLAKPDKDVVHVSVWGRTAGTVFDHEVHVGDVDVSMATLTKGFPRTRKAAIVQDARTKKARIAGYVYITLRSDDFGSTRAPTSRDLEEENARYTALQETFAREFPEKLHAIDVYLGGEPIAIEETIRHTT